MDRRFVSRKQEMLAECEVSPEVFQGTVDRMNLFGSGKQAGCRRLS